MIERFLKHLYPYFRGDLRNRFFNIIQYKLQSKLKFLFYIDFLIMLFIVILVARVVNFFVNKRRFIELAMKLPGPRAYPIVGNALKFACKPEREYTSKILKEKLKLIILIFQMERI